MESHSSGSSLITMPRGVPIDPHSASLVKKLLYEGRSQDRVSLLTGLSQPAISRIARGAVYAAVPWPDGSRGPQPLQHSEPNEYGWSADTKRYLNFPPEMQERILMAVNEQRKATGYPPIPDRADSYKQLLDLEEEEDIAEGLNSDIIERATRDEDMRLTTVMREFDLLVLAERTALREQDSIHIISSTRDTSTRPSLPPPPTVEPPKLEWEEVVSKGSGIPLVWEAEGDLHLQEAICIVFHAISQSDWMSESARRAVFEIRNKLVQKGEADG